MKKIFTSRSAKSTMALGEKIGRFLESGDVVGLRGKLGSGKTTLVKGIARAMSIPASQVQSPTFVLVHEYEGKKKIYHIDWYRLKKVQGVDAAFADQCFNEDAITLVEWPQRGRSLWPKDLILVSLSYLNDHERAVEIRVQGKKHKDFFKKIEGIR